MRAQGSGCNTGFTLMEVLLSLSLVGMIAVALGSSLHIVHSARDSAERASETARSAHVALEEIARDLTNALPPTGILAGAFLGRDPAQALASGEILGLCCMKSGRAERGPESDGIHRIAFAVGPMQDPTTGLSETCLVRRTTRNLLSPTALLPEDEVLLRGIQNLALRYFDGTTWQLTWDSSLLENALPALVEISIEILPRAVDERAPIPYRASRTVLIACASTTSTSTSSSTGGTQ